MLFSCISNQPHCDYSFFCNSQLHFLYFQTEKDFRCAWSLKFQQYENFFGVFSFKTKEKTRGRTAVRFILFFKRGWHSDPKAVSLDHQNTNIRESSVWMLLASLEQNPVTPTNKLRTAADVSRQIGYSFVATVIISGSPVGHSLKLCVSSVCGTALSSQTCVDCDVIVCVTRHMMWTSLCA